MADHFLDADEIRKSSFVRHVEIYDELGSTNDRAAELASNVNIELPSLIVARRQTAGRGRGQHTWWAADGALTFSLLIDSSSFGIRAQDWPRLSLSTAVAVCKTLADEVKPSTQLAGSSSTLTTCNDFTHCNPSSSRLRIKWPNDVFLDGAKVAGILIESPGGAIPAKDRLIVGIGINVNNSWQSAPRDTGGNGIALCDVTGRTHELGVLLVNVLRSIEVCMRQLATADPALPQTWENLCWLKEQAVGVETGGKVFDGICLGIAADGALVVENAAGQYRIHSGSVKAL
jgi:BirA family transcriptional regulator, biotin operon repressor / biotin---[acetyl-CoA-carboxylase] ligase